MSLEQAIQANTDAIHALIAQLAAGVPAAPAVAPVETVYAPPVAQATIAPSPPLPAPPPVEPAAPATPAFAAAPAFPSAAPSALPFHDNASASTWATDIYQAIGRVAPDNAMPEITGLMSQLAIANFDSLTPEKYPVLHALGQALKTKYGIA
jgi:hypothetical protein